MRRVFTFVGAVHGPVRNEDNPRHSCALSSGACLTQVFPEPLPLCGPYRVVMFRGDANKMNATVIIAVPEIAATAACFPRHDVTVSECSPIVERFVTAAKAAIWIHQNACH